MAALGSTIVMFGGFDGTKLLNDTWTWDGTTWTERTIANPPSPRRGHAMATIGDKVVLFGGSTGIGTETYANDTWTWDGTTWTPEVVSQSPPGRSSHAMATFPGALVAGLSPRAAHSSSVNDK